MILDMKILSWIEFIDLKVIVNVKFVELLSFFDFDVRSVEFFKIKEIVIENGRVYCGLFLLDGKVLIIIYSVNGVCLLFD